MLAATNPYDLVKQHYTLPDYIEERAYQIDVVNNYAHYDRAGYFLDGGCGKTFISIMVSLFKKLTNEVETTVCIMPPLLVPQWTQAIQDFQPSPSVAMYEGAPKKRQNIEIGNKQFIVMSIGIFKNDFEYLTKQLNNKKLSLIVDEAHSIKNTSSQTYRKVRDFINLSGAHIIPLTATPITSPMDGYAFIKTLTPGVYRNKRQYENIHVEDRDFFGQVTKWQNLDLLAENLALQSITLKRREIQKDLPPVQMTPISYELASKHKALYKELMENQLLELPDGGKIDATQANALYHKSQQIVCNFAHFSGNEKNKSAGIELVHQTLQGMEGKLVVVANYRMTNAHLVSELEQYGGVAIYGDVPKKDKVKNKDKFIEDPNCRVIVIQPSSAGFGVDGLQHVCSDMLFLELPVTPREFHQTVWRLDRSGQKDPVSVTIAVANGTIQTKLLQRIMDKDELVDKVQPNLVNIRDAIFGD